MMMTKTKAMVTFQFKGWVFVTKNQLVQFNLTCCNVDDDEVHQCDDHDEKRH